MTDFWVSKPKHFCNLCKVWCQGDPVSIKRHEDGFGHKNKVAHRLKIRRRAQPSGNDPEVAKQLADIEAAAASSIQATVASGHFAGSIDVELGSARSAGARTRNLAGPRSGGKGWYEGDPTADFYEPFNARSFGETQEAAQKDDEEEEDEGGEYIAKGVKYFQGKAHVDKFRTGGDCEVWVESCESWLPAVVRQVKRFSSANKGEERLYDIDLVGGEEPLRDEGGSRLERYMRAQRNNILVDVAAKDIRVAADPDGVWRPTARQDAVVAVSVPAVPSSQNVDENTGFGQWTTVAVREVDEAEEERKRLAAEALSQAKRKAELRQKHDEDAAARDRAKFMCDIEERRDALNSHLGLFDRTDVYRGVKLANDDDTAPPRSSEVEQSAVTAESTAPPPVFKKRKVNSAFRKKITVSLA